MGAKTIDRFEVIGEQSLGFTTPAKVLRDKETGVNYLFVRSGYGGGLTVMVDKDGKPIVS